MSQGRLPDSQNCDAAGKNQGLDASNITNFGPLSNLMLPILFDVCASLLLLMQPLTTEK